MSLKKNPDTGDVGALGSQYSAATLNTPRVSQPDSTSQARPEWRQPRGWRSRQFMLNELSGILGCAPTHLPAVFLHTGTKVLKLGIDRDLVARFPQADTAALSQWLRLWTRSFDYIAKMANGRNRHDLAGNDVEPISPEHTEQAKLTLGLKPKTPPQPRPTLSLTRPTSRKGKVSSKRPGDDPGHARRDDAQSLEGSQPCHRTQMASRP